MGQSFKELIKYGVVGVVGLIVDFSAFILFRDVLGLNYIVSHVLGSILAIANNFILNSYFTFKTTDHVWKRAIYFFSVAGIGIVISTSLLPVFVRIENILLVKFEITTLDQKMIQNIAKVGTTFLVAFLQFFVNKYFTFKKKQPKSCK